MDLKEYEYVSAIIEEKNFSKAAKRLFISQPSLSQYINRLETQLGVTLFDRSSTPISLTYEGELYVKAMKSIRHTLTELKAKYEDISGLNLGRLNIGLTPSKATSTLPAILPVFKSNYPAIDLTLTEAGSAELEDLLNRGAVDICIMNTPVSNNHIEYEPLMTEDIYLASPPSFKPTTVTEAKPYPHIDIKALDNEPFILLHEDQRLRQVADKLFSRHGIKPKVVLETRSIVTAMLLCSAGLGHCFVPESSVRFSPLTSQPSYYSIGSDLSWTLILAYKQGTFKSKAVEAFAATAKQIITSGEIK